MKTAEWKKRVREELPNDGSWAFSKTLAYFLPLGRVLFGLDMGNSRSAEHVFVVKVTMPLFVPSTFAFGGERIRSKSSDFIPVEGDELALAIREASVPSGTEEQALFRMVEHGVGSRNPALVEEAGYALVLLGEPRRALRVLKDARFGDDPRPFVLDMQQRIQRIIELLENDRVSDVILQLDQWVQETCGALGLRRE